MRKILSARRLKKPNSSKTITQQLAQKKLQKAKKVMKDKLKK
jgi:hypothetical protein